MTTAFRLVYDDGDDLALLLARPPMGWRGLRHVGLMQQLSHRQTPVADAILTARWDLKPTWWDTALGQRASFLRAVIALA